MTTHVFPDDFLWGVATSAYQIEGAVEEGGRGESIWDRFAASPGKIEDGSNAGVACDHYHRWREDIALMRWLGVGAYRFSIAWPRVLPAGRGAENVAGLDFYDVLVDGLLEADIEPLVTLYHWDLPQALQDRGGWAARDTVDAFGDYARLVAGRLGDRVKRWVTLNEPWCSATLGHENGHHAPGHRDPAEALRVAHHLLVAHGRAVEAVRGQVRDAELGIVLNLTPAYPASDAERDVDAARQFDASFNRWYLDPVFHGRYPDDGIADRVRLGHLAGADALGVADGDLAAAASPIDFLGVNYYSRVVMAGDAAGGARALRVVPEGELTDMGWEVYPQGLEDLLVRLDREYAPARILITENGAAYTDPPDADGRIDDRRRIEFLRAHLSAAQRAIAAGVPLAGYFAWSLLDNFEWAHGYTKRFGLHAVDFATQRRTARDSAHWYRDVVSTNSVGAASRVPI